MEKIKGGRADGKTIQDIADRHGKSIEYMIKQLEVGKKEEMEHTDDISTAEEIAKDHLIDDPDYYIKLKKVVENVRFIKRFEDFI